MRAVLLTVMAFLSCFFAGCGGAAPRSESGSARITVVWPEPSRLIPVASQSIMIRASRAQGPIATRILSRPNTSVSFENLPVGAVTMTASAHPQLNGTGTAQALGATEIGIVSGQTTTFSVTMATTIDRLDILPANPSVESGQILQLALSARDAGGNLVLISTATTDWESSATGIATVDSAGKVTGVSAGTAQITARETESGKSATVTVTVTNASPPLSPSKISIHLINSYTAGARKIVAVGPRTLKVLGLTWGLPAGQLEALRDYKARFPTGSTVVRIYYDSSREWNYDRAGSPAANAQSFWNTVLAPALGTLSQSDRQLIDYLEGPNEGEPDGFPWRTTQEAEWFGQFWAALAPIIKNNGFRPCAGSIAVGNPPGTPGEIEAKIGAFVPALQACLQAGGAWSYHAYTIQYTTDPGVEYWYSLRYRQFYDYLNRQHPAVASIPMILTEGGVDEAGNPQTSGWRARGTAAQYQQWLTWFDSEIRRDSYILGVTLFQSGDPGGWPSFEIEPIADWLADYL